MGSYARQLLRSQTHSGLQFTGIPCVQGYPVYRDTQSGSAGTRAKCTQPFGEHGPVSAGQWAGAPWLSSVASGSSKLTLDTPGGFPYLNHY
jgi:hypothetical protein